ncbi:helix-turn-helix domain-containing protein [Haladaptatus salinisoli]|uniref:helix-turn-helix domain-containing protein n=1 Tax=Haladaptatus salinisoli TaxID=2884876 RepID=UPI001D0B3890|nr:helix-turn-helix domain-containing protein [Haladaptatus salinisoli]
MRYVKFVLIPDDGGLHPVDKAFASEPSLTRQFIHEISLLNDGTAITIYQLSGDADVVEDILAEHDEVVMSHVSQPRDSVHVYVQFEPNEVIETLLEIPREYELIVDTPLEFTDRGGLRLTVVGEEEMVRRAIPELPASLRPKLEQTGDYKPQNERLFSVLTERQQEILKTAVELGYYSVPRRVTHEDLASELDCSPSNVGELLRKVESTILTEVTPR